MSKKPQITGKESVHAIKEGWLQKQGNYIKNWRDRWCQLRPGLLIYYKEPSTEQQPTNFFVLAGCQVRLCDPLKYGSNSFMIMLANGNIRYLAAADRQSRDEWIKALRQACVLRPLVQQARSETPPIVLPGADIKERLTPEHFNFVKVLGKGNYGKVMLSTLKTGTDGRYFAIKVIKKSSLVDPESLDHILSENRVMQSLEAHPFLVKLYCSFQTLERLYFVLEYIGGGELFYHIGREKRFSEDRVRFYSAEIVVALRFLHSKGIVYRDLKLENILLDVDGHVKITDFGLVKELGVASGDQQCQTFCGTPEYLAPEILEEENYGKDVDYWCCGIVMYELMVGRPPFTSGSTQNMERLFFNILHQTINIPDTLSEQARSLLAGLLERDPTKRLGSGQGDKDGVSIMEHPWYESVDWKKVTARECVPPFKPSLSSEADTGNFDSEFTQMPPILTPETPSKLAAVEQKNFGLQDFSYCADPELLR